MNKDLIKFRLNGEIYDIGELMSRLGKIAKDRERGFFLEGTNRIDISITFAASGSEIRNNNSNQIFVEHSPAVIELLIARRFNQIGLDLSK